MGFLRGISAIITGTIARRRPPGDGAEVFYWVEISQREESRNFRSTRMGPRSLYCRAGARSVAFRCSSSSTGCDAEDWASVVNCTRRRRLQECKLRSGVATTQLRVEGKYRSSTRSKEEDGRRAKVETRRCGPLAFSGEFEGRC